MQPTTRGTSSFSAMNGASAPAKATLTEDETDDLLYCCRAGDLSDLTTTATHLSTTYSVPTSALLSATDDISGNTCLHYACANGHIDVVQWILSASTPSTSHVVAATNAAGNTPLHYAALNAQLAPTKALVEVLPEAERGAYVLAKNHAGRDAAFEAENAGREGWEACVSWLLGVAGVEGGKESETAEDVGKEKDGEGSAREEDVARACVDEVGTGLEGVKLDGETG